MRLPLTTDQAAQIESHLHPGTVLLGRIHREQFDGSNADTSGALVIVFTSIPSERLDAVRAAIAGQPAKPHRCAQRRAGRAA